MLNWLKTQRARRSLHEAQREAIEASTKPPASRLKSAIKDTASVLGAPLAKGTLRRLRGPIILILARQLADANERLGSSYWSGPDGHNVGRDVLRAYAIAVEAVRGTASDTAGPSGSLEAVVDSIAQHAEDYRSRAGDPDGYGSATLGEIERDLRQLLPATATQTG